MTKKPVKQNEAIPCTPNEALQGRVDEVAEILKTQAHLLGDHGLTETEFYEGGVFRGAVERLRGQFSATMKEKRGFAAKVLDHLASGGFIDSWVSSGENNRYDYMVMLNSGKFAAIELKGCLDGNNTNIFDRPAKANEFIVWSVCANPASNQRHSVWSGVHTRLSAEIIHKSEQVDGLVVWDWLCGSSARPCPKLNTYAKVSIGEMHLPPPCIYLFPSTIPDPRSNPKPAPHTLENVGILSAFHEAFGRGSDEYINQVAIEVSYKGSETVRTTSITRDDEIVHVNKKPTPIRRK